MGERGWSEINRNEVVKTAGTWFLSAINPNIYITVEAARADTDATKLEPQHHRGRPRQGRQRVADRT